MKVLKWIFGIVIVCAAVVAIFLAHLGMFSALSVSEQKMGPYVYAYEEFVGPYQKTMPVFARVNNIIKEQGIKSDKGIGVYFDNPSQVAADKLRSNCGAIIDETDPAKLAALSQKLKIGNFAQTNCMVVKFPIKSPLSYMLAPMKVYPVLSKHMNEKGYKPAESYEIYDMPNKEIYFVIPISPR